MSNVHSTHTNVSAAQNSGRSLFGLLGGFSRRLRERREMRQLLSFNDHMLKDVGISRGDIQRQSMRSLWND